jgi:hypothetical protein
LRDDRSVFKRTTTYVNRADPVLTGTRIALEEDPIKTVLDGWLLADIHWLHVNVSTRYSGGTMEEARMLERVPQQFRELQEITMQTDTRDILAHATRQSESYEDYFLVDVDAHVTETSFWPEIIASIDNDVIRQMGEGNAARPGNANQALLNNAPGIAHQRCSVTTLLRQLSTRSRPASQGKSRTPSLSG